MEDDEIPVFRRSEVARERDQALRRMDSGIGEAVRLDELGDHANEAIHVLAGRDPGAFTLVDCAALDLPLPGMFGST